MGLINTSKARAGDLSEIITRKKEFLTDKAPATNPARGRDQEALSIIILEVVDQENKIFKAVTIDPAAAVRFEIDENPDPPEVFAVHEENGILFDSDKTSPDGEPVSVTAPDPANLQGSTVSVLMEVQPDISAPDSQTDINEGDILPLFISEDDNGKALYLTRKDAGGGGSTTVGFAKINIAFDTQNYNVNVNEAADFSGETLASAVAAIAPLVQFGQLEVNDIVLAQFAAGVWHLLPATFTGV